VNYYQSLAKANAFEKKDRQKWLKNKKVLVFQTWEVLKFCKKHKKGVIQMSLKPEFPHLLLP